MLYTSAEAAKLLRKLNSDINALVLNEQMSSQFVAATTEDVEKCRPAYDYQDTQKKLAELQGKVRKLKHAINVFNTTTVVPGFDMTIDEMLVYIPQLNQAVKKLNGMKSKLPRERVTSHFHQSNIIDYTYVNYNIEDAANDFVTASDTLAQAQLALDKVNSTVKFEVNL